MVLFDFSPAGVRRKVSFCSTVYTTREGGIQNVFLKVDVVIVNGKGTEQDEDA